MGVDGEGRVCGVNRMAARLLCQARSALIGQPFSALFDRRHPGVFGRSASRASELVEMHSSGGLLVLARFEGEAPPTSQGPRSTGGGACDAHTAVSGEPEAPPCLRALEYQAIDQALVALGGNVSAAARRLGISRNTIYRRLQQRLGEG
ncbi:MAG: hypothetical protein CFE45_17995 [Burkholderiales bacterium PBB5]|nr:MAG: hypothetical protein CFE45_17995 [Burkholderiales bacterium PBB5]